METIADDTKGTVEDEEIEEEVEENVEIGLFELLTSSLDEPDTL